MKKILSLLAMLVVTVAAMATDYTDKLVNSVYGYEATYDAAKLQITDKGSGKYDVVLKDLANSSLGYEFGDLTLSDVEGTTAGGYTTISVTDVTAKFTSGSWVATSPGCPMTSVTVKFNDTKAYASYAGQIAMNLYGKYDFTATFGTDDFGGGETVDPVTVPYTDVAYATYNGTTTNYIGHEVDVITESDGTTTIVYKGLTAGTTTFGDLTAKNVTVTEGADGSTVYTFNGDATWSNIQTMASLLGMTEGSTVALTISATAMDGEFDGTFVTTLLGSEATIVFGSSYVEPEPEPETLPLTDFLPDGATFQYPFTINWDTQKLVAKLDLTTCHENQANENLFSLSDNVDVLANWNVTDDGYLALYYTRNASLWTTSGWQNAEKRLTVHYRGAVNKNIETTIENPEEVVFEVTKDGLYAEDTQLLTAADMPKLYESNDASLFFASIQGENRSWATYKSVTIEDVEVAQPDTVAYNDVAYTTYAGNIVNYTNHEVDVVTELDGTTTVIYKGLTAGDNVFGDLTAKNVTVAEGEDGAKTYTFDGDATWSNTNTLFAAFGVTDGATTPLTINGTAKDGKLDATFVTTLLYNEATIVFGSSYVEPQQPDTVAYTNVAYATFNGTTTNYTDHEIDVVTELDGTTTLVYKNFTVGSNVLGDLTAKNVTVEDAEDGSKVYTFDGEATWSNTDGTFTIFGVAEDATTPLTIDAILKDGEFAATYNTTLQSLPVVVVFGSAYVDPGEGVEVIPDGYTPNGDKFNYTADIDWDKQYLEAEIDLSTCTGSNEGILSVGQTIASWSGAPHFHLYYPGSNTKGNLEINYLNADGSSPVRGHVNASGVVTITISKRTGITINDQNGNILYEDKGTFSSRDSISSIYSELWALTNIEVGSQEGSGRSHATYNSVRIYDLEEEVPVVVDEQTFTDKLVIADSEGNSQTVDNATIVLRTYDDGSYDLLMEDFGYGDVVVKPVTLATEDGVTYITGETTVTVNGDEWVVAVDGMKTGTDKLVLDFEFTDPDDEEFYIEGTFGATENGIGGIEKKVSGADAIYTISGAKVNSLQKGINIVRINGKTIKVVKK